MGDHKVMDFLQYSKTRLQVLQAWNDNGKLDDRTDLITEFYDLLDGNFINERTVINYFGYCNGSQISYADFVSVMCETVGVTSNLWHTITENDLLTAINKIGSFAYKHKNFK